MIALPHQREVLLLQCIDPTVPMLQRFKAGMALGLLGDSIRFVEGRGPIGARYLLPRPSWRLSGRDCKGWIAVPAGRQQFGRRLQLEADIRPGLALAFAPTTNAEFACFVQDGGYGSAADSVPPPWWQGKASVAWWQGTTAGMFNEAYETIASQDMLDDIRETREMFRLRRYPDNWTWPGPACTDGLTLEAIVEACLQEQTKGVCREPGWWDEPLLTAPLQPVVGVNAFEAEAYCRWLSAQTGKTYRLPFEAEREAALRQGQPDRRWPWGDQYPDPTSHLNQEGTGLARTAPIGCFPAGDSLEGLTDCSGQVWEWMANDWGNEDVQSARNQNASKCDDFGAARAVRGGSWDHEEFVASSACRHRYSPEERLATVGFRLLSCDVAA